MPLRDHFRPPVSAAVSWEELHGQWPAVLVQQLKTQLPPGYVAGPRVHSGARVEVDVATYERDDAPAFESPLGTDGTATALWAPAAPSLAVETELPDFDEYEVRVYDATRGRTLVAAIELVSPANKDRPEHRAAFVTKCAALVQKGVAVSIIDLVTERHSNLYADLLAHIGHADPTLGDSPSHLYAASCRWVRHAARAVLQGWAHPLVLGEPLPTLPLWLTADRAVPLDLEASYERACGDLWLT